MRILIVDDSRDTADSQALLVENWGHEARTAYSAAAAFALACTWKPDAILMDVAMPEEDGIALAKRLRDLPGSKQTLLIAISGYTDLDIRERASQWFDHYLFKPVDLDALKARLRHEAGGTHFRASYLRRLINVADPTRSFECQAGREVLACRS